MTDSPLVELLAALDRRDVPAAMALCAPDCLLAGVDGRHAEGRDAVQHYLSTFLSTLRSVRHEIVRQWHQDDAWIAEIIADYELQDRTRIEGRPRAFVLLAGADGIRELRVYGANERPLTQQPTGYVPARLGGRLILPL